MACGYRCWHVSLLFLCLIGIIICLYAYYVEVAKESDPSYEAYCDISEFMSCSRVLTSKYSRGFGLVGPLLGEDHWLNIPNSLLGLVFFMLEILLSFSTSTAASTVALGTVVLANCGSVYLGYILFYVLRDVCLVCCSLYLTDFLLLGAVLGKRSAVQAARQTAADKGRRKKRTKKAQ